MTNAAAAALVLFYLRMRRTADPVRQAWSAPSAAGGCHRELVYLALMFGVMLARWEYSPSGRSPLGQFGAKWRPAFELNAPIDGWSSAPTERILPATGSVI